MIPRARASTIRRTAPSAALGCKTCISRTLRVSTSAVSTRTSAAIRSIINGEDAISMTQTDPLAADQEFFDSLVSRNGKALDRLLADDFVLIDVMQGSEMTKAFL